MILYLFQLFLLTVLSTAVLAVYLPNVKDEADSKILTYDYKVLEDGYTFE